MIGINPDPFTLRELMHMWRGRVVENWDHTAFISAMLVNVAPFRKKNAKPVSFEDFHPYRKKKRKPGIPLTKENLWMLKAFVPGMKVEPSKPKPKS